jgi:hypothetical protein
MDAAWWTFILAANSVYTKLTLGAKGHGPSQGWMERKDRERRKDELLSYIHQARNSDEHNLQGSLLFVHRLKVSIVDGAGYRVSRPKDGGGIRITRTDPNAQIKAKIQRPGVHLKPVTNRGRTYPPPSIHLGKPLKDTRPLAVAKLGLEYLEQLVLDASTLVQA